MKTVKVKITHSATGLINTGGKTTQIISDLFDKDHMANRQKDKKGNRRDPNVLNVQIKHVR